MQRANYRLLPILLLAAASVPADRAAAQTATTGLRITLDAEAVEIVRAWRRSQGLDAPDAQADARVAALLQRMHAVASHGPPETVRPVQAAAAEQAAPWHPTNATAVAPLPPSRRAPVGGIGAGAGDEAGGGNGEAPR